MVVVAKQHAVVLRQRHVKAVPTIATLSDEDLLVRHYMHVATQGLYLTGPVGPHVEALHDAGLRLLANRSWGLRKTEEASVRKVVQLALQYNLGIETY